MTDIVQPGAMARRVLLRAVAAGAGAAVSAAGGWRPACAEDPKMAVNIDNFAFTPPSVMVKPGTIVTWTNRDDIPHVVLMQSLKLRSKVMDTNDSFSYRFEKPGSFDYFCALHPHMKGQVIVSG